MKYGLNILEKGTLDLVALGALNHRVDPGIVPFRKATSWEVHPSGGEYNVAADLSDCFRLRTGLVSAMVDYPIGELIAERVRSYGHHALLQGLPAQRRQRAQHGHDLQRPRVWHARRRWCSTTAPTRPPPSSSPVTSTGRRSLQAGCAGSTAAGFSPPFRRRPAR